MLLNFRTNTVSEVTGASVRQLDHWARTGLLKPSGQDANGKGSKRLYTFQDVIAIRVIVQLRARNCPLQKVRQAISALKKQFPTLPKSQLLAGLTLLTDGSEVYLVNEERDVMEIVTKQVVWSVPLGLLVMETARKVESLPQTRESCICIGESTFHITAYPGSNSDQFVAECKELPGLLEFGASIEDAWLKAEKAIKTICHYRDKKFRQNLKDCAVINGTV